MERFNSKMWFNVTSGIVPAKGCTCSSMLLFQLSQESFRKAGLHCNPQSHHTDLSDWIQTLPWKLPQHLLSLKYPMPLSAPNFNPHFPEQPQKLPRARQRRTITYGRALSPPSFSYQRSPPCPHSLLINRSLINSPIDPYSYFSH